MLFTVVSNRTGCGIKKLHSHNS